MKPRIPNNQASWSNAARRIAAVAAVALILGPSGLLAEEVLDADIVVAIDDELWIDNVVNANSIDVAANTGVVTLVGTADTILAKERAARIAATTVGVRAVVNLIEVEPAVTRTDAELENAVENALLTDPAADSYEIGVSVVGGVSTLTGTVESWQEKQLSEAVAKDVKGVTGIENDIRVVYAGERVDREIEADIEGRLANDVRVDDFLIEVDVENGKVILSGTVGSLAEKRIAMSDAWVSGATEVDGKDLEIKWWARDDMRRKSSYVGRSDEEIEDAVRDAFVFDPRVFSFQPEVSVSGSAVTLTGVVDNLAAKRAAEQDARNVIGVWRVKNHLKVRPLSIPSDDELEERIASAFLEDPYLERWDINIDAGTGLVVLSGEVNTSFEKKQAERVAERVKGVLGVVNNIDFDYRWTWKADWEIEADIEDELWWSPYVDANQVEVSVDNGVATLSGTVETWSERNSAEKNAFDGGAKDVRNNLTVTYRFYGPDPHYFDPPLIPYGF